MADLVTTRVETLSSDATSGGVKFLLTATLKGSGAPTDDSGIITVEVTWLDSETVEDLELAITNAFVSAGSALGHNVTYVDLGPRYTSAAVASTGYRLSGVLRFGSYGSTNGLFKYPRAIATDSAGNIFAADYENYRVQKFNSGGVYQSQFGSSGTGNGQFSSIRGIAIDSSDNIWVLDGTRVQKFNSSGVYQSQFGSSGTGNGQFGTTISPPRGIAIDSSGNVYVADTGNNRVQKFNSSGVYQSQFGSSGNGNGQFPTGTPTGISFDSSGNIFVASGSRIQKFTSAGVYSSTIPLPSGSAEAVTLDGLNNVFVCDYFLNRIQLFNSSGELMNTYGSYGSGFGLFRYPQNVFYSSVNKRVYVADTENNRIQVFEVVSATESSPTIVDFSSANHNHTNASTGGQIGTGTPTNKNFLRGDFTWQTLGSMVYQNTATSGNVATGGRDTQTVSCTGSDVLIGGGCTMSGAAVRVAKSFPSSTTTWSCTMENNTGSNQTITAYVICVDSA